MPNLTRTTPRPAVRASAAPPRTKILLVRQPVKSVRRSDEPDRTPVRLAIGVIVALGIVAAIWLMGYLGFRLGFAELVRVRDLEMEASAGLATGTMMLIAMPQVILQAGIDQPMWLMLGFLLIAIPAGTLGAIKPSSPGGPKPKAAAVVLSFTGAIAAALNGVAMIAWTISPFRNQRVVELPFDPSLAETWVANLQTVGGLDVLGTVAAAVWVVVVMRLAIPRWLRGLCASACFFALVVILVAMSMTNATIAQITADRSVLQSEDARGERLILGYTPQYVAILSAEDQQSLIYLQSPPAVMTVVRKKSIVGYLRDSVMPEP